jgi:hypothetical protein
VLFGGGPNIVKFERSFCVILVSFLFCVTYLYNRR